MKDKERQGMCLCARGREREGESFSPKLESQFLKSNGKLYYSSTLYFALKSNFRRLITVTILKVKERFAKRFRYRWHLHWKKADTFAT